MKRALPVLLALITLSPAALADLTDARRAEQQELLAWVKTLRYQARTDQALGVCAMILEADPECVDAWIEHGVMTLADGHVEEAKEDFRSALKLEGKHPMALVGRGHVHHAAGDVARAQEDASKALKQCNRAIARERAEAGTYYARGLAKMLLEDETALQDFVMAISLDPTHMDAHTERAHIYRARKRPRDAIDQLTKAVEIRPDYAVGYLARARVHYEIGDLNESVADCDRALEINPGYARAWHNRGLVNIQRGDLEAAISDLTEAISVEPDYASARVYRGQAYLAYGNRAAARADWEAVRELDPDGWAGQTAKKMLNDLQQAAGGGG